jgi:phosphoglycolate phosphatase
MIIKGIVFDLDGTLLDTIEDISDSVNCALRRFGLPEHPPEAYRRFVGEGFLNLVKRAISGPLAQDEAYAGSVLDAARSEYFRVMKNKSHPYGGIHDLVNILHNKAVRLAVLSNKPHANTVDLVNHYFPEINFYYIAGAVPEKPIKPDPLCAFEAAAAMALAPEECAFVGDSSVDMETGKNAGMLALGAAWGFRGRRELEDAGAAFVADTPDDLRHYLERHI